MPEALPTVIPPEQRALDRRLIASLFLSSSAAALEIFVGYCVAHWITITASKTTGWIVSLCCFLLVLAGGALAWTSLRQLGAGDETLPNHGRRVFMAQLALLLTGFSFLVVLAGTLILLTVHPND